MSIEESIQLASLRSFLTVYRTGSFTAAAREMHRAQSRVSDQIRQLERNLGVQLFIRGRSHVSLTSAGRELLPYAQEVMRQIQQGASLVADRDGVVRGQVTIRSYPAVSAFVIAPLMQRFRMTYPHVDVQLSELSGHLATEDLIQGEVDLAVEADSAPSRPRFSVTPFFDEPVVCLVPAGHPLAGEVAVSPRALRGQTVIMTGEPRRGICPCRQYLERAHVQTWREYIVGHPTTVPALVASGVGVGVMPALAAQLLDTRDSVTHLAVTDSSWVRHVVLVTDGARILHRAVERFISDLLQAPLPSPLEGAEP